MNTTAIDFETYYSKDCTINNGLTNYLNHPDFSAYMVSIYSDDNFAWVGHPKDAPWEKLEGHTILAHNRSFDEPIYKKLVADGVIPDTYFKDFHCTADMSSYLGWGRSLAESLKNSHGVMMKKEVRDKMKGRNFNDISREEKKELAEYALYDSKGCLSLWDKGSDDWPLHEREMSRETTRMCERGMPIDEGELEAGIELLQVKIEGAIETIPYAEQQEGALSPKDWNEYCRSEGVLPPPCMSKDDPAVREWMKRHPKQSEVLEATHLLRGANSLLKKLKTMQSRVVDGRFGYSLKYFGAHTGRDSGAGGFNVQNMPRGEMYGVDLRSMIKAPEGKVFLIADLAQIEARCVAYLAGEWGILEKAKGGSDWYEAQARGFGLFNGESPMPQGLRHTMKQMALGCIAEGQLVLTDRGEIPIESVQITDKVWDGKEYVTHEGVIYKGYKEVITYEGITATPDHKVHTSEGWVSIGEAASSVARITTSGLGTAPIWTMDSSNPYIHSEERREIPSLPMRMWYRTGSVLSKLKVRKIKAVPQPSLADGEAQISNAKIRCCQAKMHKSQLFRIPQLWGSGNRVSFRDSRGYGGLGSEKPWGTSNEETSYRSDRQQRTLRGRESAMGNSFTKQGKPTSLKMGCIESKSEGSGNSLGNCPDKAIQGVAAGEMVGTSTQAHVYDILNAGPRRRFTVSGKLVANCQYGMGASKFASITGVDFERSQSMVRLFRAKMPKLVNLWKKLERDMRSSVGDDYSIVLPSGRELNYKNILVKNGLSAEVIHYGKKTRRRFWSGILIENATQAFARDVFMDRVLAISNAGYDIILRVHDEVVIEVDKSSSPQAAADIQQILTTSPLWCRDLPLGTDVDIVNHYQK
jgi:DNA polymerase I-like protein with 3'-5' exonuclease and polymerase domains